MQSQTPDSESKQSVELPARQLELAGYLALDRGELVPIFLRVRPPAEQRTIVRRLNYREPK